MTVVVSDTSPIRCLAHLSLMGLFQDLFGQVLIPPSVQAELLRPAGNSPALALSPFAFVRVQSPRDQKLVQQLLERLDPGEAEALALAIEVQPATLIIDERRGRRIAQQHGVPMIGTLGILLEAKRQGRLGIIRPLIERLDNELRFFVSAGLRARALHLAGE